MTAPLVIIHRRNRIEQLSGLPRECWIEADIDVRAGEAVLSHDPAGESSEKLAEFLPLALAHGVAGFVFDCKREGVEQAVQPLVAQHKIENYFYLNEMEIAADIFLAQNRTHRSAIRIWQHRGAADVIRYAEDKKAVQENGPNWAWIDCWQRGLQQDIERAFIPLGQSEAHQLQRLGVKLCVCSPELYAHDYDRIYEKAELEKLYRGVVRYRRNLMQAGIHNDAVCTKFPWLWTMDIDLLLAARDLSA